MNHNKTFLVLCVLGTFLWGFIAPLQAAQSQQSLMGYHKATTEVEAALDGILKRENNTLSLLQDRTESSLKEHNADAYFTKRLVSSWLAAQKKSVKQACGAKLDEEGTCGLDYDPLLCAQDDNDGKFLYRTVRTNKHEAVIGMQWEGNTSAKPVAKYKLINETGVWKVDGVKCTNGGAFHFSGASLQSEFLVRADGVRCKTDVRVVSSCFDVTGTVSVHANLRAYLRDDRKGKTYILGFESDALDSKYLAPEPLLERLGSDHDVVGVFTVCPFSRGEKGKQQTVCISAVEMNSGRSK